MKPKDDFSEALVEDFIRETANTFFGTRKQLEDMIASFHEAVEELREKEAWVAERANLLNFLLLRGKAAEDFYLLLKLDAKPFATGIDFTERVLPEKIPFSLSEQKKIIKLVLWAYEALQQECHAYMNGKYFIDPDEGIEKVTVHYNQIRMMTDLINERVHKVNTEMSPVCVLQYARKFDLEAEAKERITGGGVNFGGYACSIDKKLAYDPVDFESLNLKEFPDLPTTDQVKADITRFCKNLYPGNKHAIHQIVSDLTHRIQHAASD